MPRVQTFRLPHRVAILHLLAHLERPATIPELARLTKSAPYSIATAMGILETHEAVVAASAVETSGRPAAGYEITDRGRRELLAHYQAFDEMHAFMSRTAPDAAQFEHLRESR